MKSLWLAMPLILSASLAFAGTALPTTTTKSNATLFLGLSWTFGSSSGSGTSGVTLKALSTNKPSTGALAAGVTYNFDQTFGCDIGVAYNGSGHETLTMGYDLCKRAPQISVGASGRAKTTTTGTVMKAF